MKFLLPLLVLIGGCTAHIHVLENVKADLTPEEVKALAHKLLEVEELNERWNGGRDDSIRTH